MPRQQELVKIRTNLTKRRNYIRKICISTFGRFMKEHNIQIISNQFLTLCQMGMDEYNASKLTILSASGNKKSRTEIEQFEERARRKE